MAQTTEAACLLETGALYPRRLLLRSGAADPIFAGFKSGAFSLYFGDAPIVHFDLDGRWQRAFLDGIHQLKGLDASVQSIGRVREGDNLVLKRHTLRFDETADLDATIRGLAIDLAEKLDARRLEIVEPPSRATPITLEALRDILEEIARWDASAWFSHRETYLKAYPNPLPLLPPDCTNAVIVASEVGGNFMDHDAFTRHTQVVSKLLGRRIEQCRSIFLAGRRALNGPIESQIRAIANCFPIEPRPDDRPDEPHRLAGIHTYLDDFATPPPDIDQLRVLRGLGLKRVSLGLDSGDVELRRSIGHDIDDAGLIALVTALKLTRIGVGLIVPVGFGGEANAERHLEATASLLNRLPLGPGDLVSILDADDLSLLSAPKAPRSVPHSDRDARLERFRGLLDAVRARKAKVAPFRPEKQGFDGG